MTVEVRPFNDLAPGDVLRIIYDGAPAALMVVTKVKQHSVEGRDGQDRCKLTWVGNSDFRFYADLGLYRYTVLRPVQWKQVRP